MDATATVAKAIMSAPTGNGKLTATILSVYDLPDDEVPTAVLMSYKEGNSRGGYREISTGPPAAKHREHANSFKFGGAHGAGAENRLVLAAPLATLFEATVTFTLTYGNTAKNMSSKCTVHKTLRVNETQWLILDLASESGAVRGDTSPTGTGNKSVGDQPPTLRLKLRLEGPYRPEISAVINLANSWFGAVDLISGAVGSATAGLVHEFPKRAGKLLLIPTVPLATLAVAALPIVGGLLIIGIPFLLPLLIMAIISAVGLGAVGSAAYFSTRDGRTRLQNVAEPTYQTFLMTSTGQRIIYDVGPRPSPQALAHAVLPTDMIGKLVVSLIIDLVGSASYLIPLAGEAFDLTWAPISMVLVGALYDDVLPNLKYVALMEELLPFTDWIPSATLGWAKEFGPGILDQGKRAVGEAKMVGRREKEALMSMAR